MRQAMAPKSAAARRVAAMASIVWAGLVTAYGAGYVGTRSPEGAEFALALLALLAAIAVPVALFWTLAWLHAELLARHAATQGHDDQIRALQTSIATLEKRLKTLEGAKPRAAAEPAPAPAPDPSGGDKAPAAGPPPAAPPPVNDQPDLPLEGALGPGALSMEDTIRALNFPRNADDRAGFAVLKRALESHDLARLLQASEDCLNLLAHEGIYMDDLFPAPASAGDWRQFARGGAERAALLPLNGITDARALETVRKAMRSDPIFRDAALHFQRQFDQMLHRVAPEADDRSLLDLVDTRSGRAFVLLVQASGPRNG